ncbi:MAG TPA: tyrosine-protein phosphatase [Jatrophihabitans sp.]|jgi:protein tyrosine/serine phosphatase
MPDAPNWLELEGGANARDVGGIPAQDGRQIRFRALIRSANLQHLTEADIRQLVTDVGVRTIVDLRTDVEVDAEGPGPMTRQPDVTIHHLSLFPDTSEVADDVSVNDVSGDGVSADEAAGDGVSADEASGDGVSADEASGDGVSADEASVNEVSGDEGSTSRLLPWHDRDRPPIVTGEPVADLYLTYLERRPDSVVAALRAIAEPDGAALVHCAAGKDRTGVVVAIALTLVGAERSAVVADYAATEQQIAAIMTLLGRTATYQREVADPASVPPPTAAVMTAVLDALTGRTGGIEGWLASHGWTAADTQRLRAKLLS